MAYYCQHQKSKISPHVSKNKCLAWLKVHQNYSDQLKVIKFMKLHILKTSKWSSVCIKPFKYIRCLEFDNVACPWSKSIWTGSAYVILHTVWQIQTILTQKTLLPSLGTANKRLLIRRTDKMGWQNGLTAGTNGYPITDPNRKYFSIPDPYPINFQNHRVFRVSGIRETSQELRMLSSVTINCQVTKIVINPGSQL